MTPPPQHPQRCENGCSRFEKSSDDKVMYGLCHISDGTTIYLYDDDIHRISIIGCASHTSAGAQQRIDALEKSLKWIVKEIDSPNDWETSLHNIRAEALALLQAGDKE